MRGRPPWSDRRLVEQCRSISVTNLVRDHVITPSDGPESFKYPPPRSWSDGFEVFVRYKETSPGEGTLKLVYTIRGNRIEDEVEVTSIPSPLGHGGRRYYLRCPGVKGPCGRRVGKLYLPPGESFFACRECHDLTYRSVKEHDKKLDAFRRMSTEELSVALRSQDWSTRARALRAVMLSRGYLR